MSFGSSKVLCFVGGAAAACIGAALANSKGARDVAVNAVSKGMILKDNISAGMQSIKDDAEDLCADARKKAKEDAARAAKIAEIEARVRAQVEAELASEEEAKAKSAKK